MTSSLSLRRCSGFPRAISPAPLGPALSSILRAWRDSGQGRSSNRILEEACEQIYPKRKVILARSGTAALYTLFRVLRENTKRNIVLLSAYTCPDIAAAIIRAGLKPALLDVYPRSIMADPSSADIDFKSVAAVVVSILYGIPEDLHPWFALSRDHDFLVIDDACQSALSSDGSGRIGGRGESVGILSFGRGKAFAGVGGGALVLPKSGVLFPGFSTDMWNLLVLSAGRESGSMVLSGAKECIALTAGMVFGKPQLYWFPDSLPFLGLGRTQLDLHFSLSERSRVAYSVALAQVRNHERLFESQHDGFLEWLEVLGDVGLSLVNVVNSNRHALVRFPLLCSSEEVKRKFLEKAARLGLGVTGSYPSTLEGYHGLSPIISPRGVRRAQNISRCLVTLPNHSSVRAEDRQEIFRIFREFI